jgi:hypothetical protein
MLELIKGANLLLRFLLELCALGALGYWGFKTGSVTSTKVVLGVGAPLVAAVVWGTFLSPRACYELGRKPHRNAGSTISLVPSRSLFPAFLSCF